MAVIPVPAQSQAVQWRVILASLRRPAVGGVARSSRPQQEETGHSSRPETGGNGILLDTAMYYDRLAERPGGSYWWRSKIATFCHSLVLAGRFLPDLEVVMSRSNWIHWSLLAGLLVCVGCGEKPASGTVPVTGLVMLDDKPVAGATVSFSPDAKGGRAAVGTTDASGRYTLTTKKPGDGAMPGAYTVMITKTAEAQRVPERLGGSAIDRGQIDAG